MRQQPAIPTSLALLVCALLIAGCGSTPTSAGIEPEIVNEADSFEYQVSLLQDYSGTATYQWVNTGTAANLNLSTFGESGAATLTVEDATGTALFSGALDDRGTVVTDAGTAGEWTLRVEYASFSGTVNFRAEKAT